MAIQVSKNGEATFRLLDGYKTGVYAIVNQINGKRYIGSTSIGFKSRWNSHIYHLARGTHHSRHLQGAWEKYGDGAFVFEVLLICSKSDVLFYEQIFLDSLKTCQRNHGYNICPIAGSPVGVPKTESQIAKCAASHRGKKRSDVARQNMKDAWTDERRKLISDKSKGRIVSEETKELLSKNRKGKPLSQETKRKMSLATKGRKQTPEHIKNRADAHRGSKRSPEVCQKFSEMRRGKPSPLKGRSVSDETKLKLSIANKGKVGNNKGKKMSDETKRKLSESARGRVSAFKGRKHTQESLGKMSASQKGKKQSPEHIAKRLATRKAIQLAKQAAKKNNEGGAE